jgi:hypothetical protein
MGMLASSRDHPDATERLIRRSCEAVESSRALLTRTREPPLNYFSGAAQYDVHFVDHGNRVFDAVVVERYTDVAAIEHAHRLDVLSIGAGFDVWHEGRLVHMHRR